MRDNCKPQPIYGGFKLTRQQLEALKARAIAGESTIGLAREFKVNTSTVRYHKLRARG